jgi:hypothetical protein
MMHGAGMGHGQGGMGGPHSLLTTAEIGERLTKWVKKHVSKRLTVTAPADAGPFAARADVTTADGSLVMQVVVDKRNGQVWRLD